jgi:hypothetical protein
LVLLCRKDFLAVRRYMPLGLVLYGFHAAGFILWPLGFVLVNLMFAGVAVLGLALLEELNRSDVLFNSLPATRRLVVRARFVTAGCVTAGTAIMGTLVGWLLAALLGARGPAPLAFPSPEVGLWVIGVLTPAFSVFLVLLCRDGFERTAVLLPAILAGGAVVLSAAGYLGLWLAARFHPAGASAWARSPLAAAQQALLVTFGGWGYAPLALVLTGLVVLALVLAERLYERRDL